MGRRLLRCAIHRHRRVSYHRPSRPSLLRGRARASDRDRWQSCSINSNSRYSAQKSGSSKEQVKLTTSAIIRLRVDLDGLRDDDPGGFMAGPVTLPQGATSEEGPIDQSPLRGLHYCGRSYRARIHLA